MDEFMNNEVEVQENEVVEENTTTENTEVTTVAAEEQPQGLTTGEKVAGAAGAALAIYGAVDLSIKGYQFCKKKIAPKVKAGFKKLFGKKEEPKAEEAPKDEATAE